MGKKTKIPYRFTLRDDALFSFAGIWEEFESTEGETQHTFMILTTSPNQSVKEIHDQMPVMLTRETEKIWLNNYSSHEELSPILAPFSADAMLSYTVSPLVNSPANDSSALIRRTSPMDQHGNYTLFG